MSVTFLTEYTFLQKISGDSSAATLTQLKAMVNIAYRALSMEGRWPWLRYSSHLNLEGPYQTGTVTVTKGSTAVTSSGATFDTSWADRELQTASGAIYRVSAIPTNGTLTLETAASVTETAVTYTLFRRRYTLPARMRDIEALLPIKFPRTTILPVGPDEMALLLSNTLIYRDPPNWWAPADSDTTNNVFRAEFYPIPNSDQTVLIRGLRFPADLSNDGDLFLFTEDYIDAYRQKALALLFQWRNDYERMQAHEMNYRKAVDLLRRREMPDAERSDALTLDEGYFSANWNPRDGLPRYGRLN